MSATEASPPAKSEPYLQEPKPARESSSIHHASMSSGPSVQPLHRWYVPVKWLVEYLLTIVLLVAAIPFLLLGALCIKATSRGPIFYLQQRMGKQGRIFRVIKLRTMIDNAEGQTGPVWACGDDPRITPVGRFLRNTHIDEFPQLINVLCGHMALIGPRPERPEIILQLEWQIPNYAARTNVRPGITGLSQLQLPPDSDLESVRRKLIFDLYYVRHLSPWLDLRIFCSTAYLLCSALLRGAWQLIALPQSPTVLYSVERIVGPNSELIIAQRNVRAK